MPNAKQLKRQKVSVSKAPDGTYTLVTPQRRGLVLSGGGYKGITYIGLINALHKRDQLTNLTHVSGASAGAITASFIAVGIPPHDIEKLISQLDPIKLLDRNVGRAKGDRLRNIFDIIYMVQIKKHLQTIKSIPQEHLENYEKLFSKIDSYEKALEKQGLVVENIDEVLKLSHSIDDLKKLNSVFNDKSLENITMGDLSVVRNLLPADDKHVIKHLSIGVTNQTKKALERYSEDKTPNQPLAQVVQWSGAHPLLFKPGRNAMGELMGDSGILDNMPEIESLDREEIICVKAEAASNYHKRVKKAEEDASEMLTGFKRALDLGFKSLFGGTWLNSTASLLNREKVFYQLDNMIYLNAGEITTINASATQAQKEQAIKNAYTQTLDTIQGQEKKFDHPLLALLYVGLEHLDQTLLNDTTDSELFRAAMVAKTISFFQTQMIEELNNGEPLNALKRIEDILENDTEMDSDQRDKALTLCLKQVNFLSDGKLMKTIMEETVKNQPIAIRALKFILRPIQKVFSSLTDLTPPKPIQEIQRELKNELMNTQKKGKPTAENSSKSTTYKEKITELTGRNQEKATEQVTNKPRGSH